MKNKISNDKRKKLIEPFNLFARYIVLELYKKQDNVEGMYRNLYKLKPIYKKKPSYYYRLAELAFRQKKYKQSLDHIHIAVHLSGNHINNELLFLKSKCLIQLGESNNAITCLKELLSAKPNQASVWKKLADEYQKINQWENATKSLKSYMKLKPKDSKTNIQLAECYQKLGDNTLTEHKYKQAQDYYQRAIKYFNKEKHAPSLAKINYKLGLIQLNKNESEKASRLFDMAIQYDNKLNSQRFGIGVFHEHFKEWDYAIMAYKIQLENNDNDAELYFKLGSLLDKLKKPEAAVDYYEKALEMDKVRSPWHFALANCYEQLGDYENAITWYERTIARQEKHRPGNYRRLANVLRLQNRNEEALDYYKEADLFTRPGDISKKFHEKNITKPEIRYAINYEFYSLNNKMILYRSSGARLTDNPYAIFNHLINDTDFKDYVHIWVVESFNVVPDELRSLDNIIFVKKASDAYRKYMACAKYIICNSKLEDYFIRKPNQLYLQTSHGIFYKTMGRDQTRSSIGSIGGTRNLLQATHIIMPNNFMVSKQPRCYSIEGINSGQIAK